MAEVKWIKIVTDVFDDEKILMIETMPECDTIIVIWFKLLCLAGKQNNSGVFMMGQMPYTDEMFSAIFRRPINSVRLALKTFEQFGMIEIVRDTVTIPNWSKHQSLDAYEKKKERDRLYQAERRAAQRALTQKSSYKSSDIAPLEEDKEKEIDLEIDNKKESVTCKQVVDLFHSICISFPKIRSISDARKKAIKARLNTYSLEDFKAVFENAEASSFLKGSNDRNWTATFDWLIKDSNMAKVLEGNYADKGSRYGGRKEKVPGWLGYQHSESELDAIRRVMEQEDPEAQEERDQLARELQESFGRNI
jgi:predicted phage replisome organizer